MSNASSEPAPSVSPAPWNPWLGVVFVVAIFFASQLFAGILVWIYPVLKHWSAAQANDWLSNSVTGQFIFILVAEAFVLSAIYLFLRVHNANFKLLGLKKPRWSDVGRALLAAPVYYVLFFIMVGIVSHSVHGFNAQQQQDIGFTDVHGSLQLLLTFASLVILPPLTEEIMVRGFLYGSLRRAMPVVNAALVTSLIFAAAHLPEGGAAGPLWIGALDTFILSLVLVYLREKTGSLWSSITLHAIKNGVAFVALFVIHLS